MRPPASRARRGWRYSLNGDLGLDTAVLTAFVGAPVVKLCQHSASRGVLGVAQHVERDQAPDNGRVDGAQAVAVLKAFDAHSEPPNGRFRMGAGAAAENLNVC